MSKKRPLSFEILESRTLLSAPAGRSLLPTYDSLDSGDDRGRGRREAVIAARRAARVLSVTSGDPNTQFLTPLTTSSETTDKPQSKVWRYADTWWTVLPTSSGTFVWRLDGTSWTQGLKLSSRTNTHADVLPVGDVTHVLLYRGSNSELASIQYEAGDYVMWSQRASVTPVALTSGSETAVIDMDSTGRMWLAADANLNVEVRYSDYPYSSFSAPIVVASGTNSDDIADLIAMPNGTIGVMWSDQNTRRFGFRVHIDGDDPAHWSADEVPASQSALNVGGGMADDHLNFAVASDGTLYAAVKTSYDTDGFPEIALLVRRPNGLWDDLYEVAPNNQGTRPIVVLNEAKGWLRVFFTSQDGGGNIVFRESPLSSISFGPTQTLIAASNLNNVTSTKQNVTDEMLIVASTSTQTVGARVSFLGVPVQPPIVYAGADKTIGGSTTSSLDGSAAEGRPNPPGSLVTTWSKLSGPGTVTFADSSSVDTVATFSESGTYVLRLTASDGPTSSSDDVKLKVLSFQTTSMSFQDGAFPSPSYAGTIDSRLKSGSPSSNFGNNTTIGADGSPDESALLRWDVSSIPAGSIVHGVSVTLTVTDKSTDTYEVYELKRNWNELQVSWNHASKGIPWQIAGAQGSNDRGATILGVIAAPIAGVNTFPLNLAGVAVVQSWINDSNSNFGLIIQDYATAGDSLGFSSSEVSAAASRPKLTITYEPPTNNRPPTAVADFYVTPSNATFNLSAPGVLQNDSDPDGDSLSAVLVDGPSNGSLTLRSDGSFDYTPNPSYAGPDSFTYRSTDGKAPSNVASVSINVNAAPQAKNDSYETPEDTKLSVAAPGILFNDSDANGDVLSVILVDAPAVGLLKLNADGSFDYTPPADYFGPVSFTYNATDGTLTSGIATVSIDVASRNDAPSFTKGLDQFVPMDGGRRTVSGWAANIKPGPSNEAGQSVQFVVSNNLNTLFTSQPTITPDGTLIYEPAPGATGTATVTVQLQDDGGTAQGGVDISSPQTFSISVQLDQVTVSFQDGVAGYSGTRDVKIRSGTPTFNYRTATTLSVDGDPDDSSILFWDISSIPAGSTIVSVSLTLTVNDKTSDLYELYAMKRSWLENQTTWNEATAGVPWEIAGAQGASDRGTTVLGIVTGGVGSITIVLNTHGIAVVQSWIDGTAPNFGFIIQDYSAATDSLGIRSREWSIINERPNLTVSYRTS